MVSIKIQHKEEKINIVKQLANENLTTNESIELNALQEIINELGKTSYYSHGELCEQRVCQRKVNNVWTVCCVERGIPFEVKNFETCYDSCIEVIRHFSDTKLETKLLIEKFNSKLENNKSKKKTLNNK